MFEFNEYWGASGNYNLARAIFYGMGSVKKTSEVFQSLILSILLLLSLQGVAEIQDENTLNLAAANTTSGMVCGNIIKEAYMRIGISANIQYLPAARALALSTQGKVDGEVCRILSAGQGIKTLVRVPVPYLSFHGKAFSIKPSVRVNSTLDLAKYKSGILNGMIYSDNLTKNSKRIKVNSTRQLFRMLISDHLNIDLVITTELSGRITLAQEFPDEDIHMSKINLVDLPVYHYLHLNKKKLLPRIEASLRGMLNSGETVSMKEAFIVEYIKE